MLITHALNGQKPLKTQTPNRKIKHIVATKNPILNPTNKNLSNKKINIQNKQNENPNIKKSPNQQKQNIFYPQPSKQTKIKSQYYTGTNGTTRQSPIKKILFVKNLSYKSTKTSKNASLDNKKQQSSQSQDNKYLSLGHQRQQNVKRQIHQRKSYSHYTNTNCLQNESEIYQQQRLSEKPIQELKTKDMMLQNQSQASYRLSVSPNELYPKSTQFNNQKYNQTIQNKPTQQRINSVSYHNQFGNEKFNQKYNKMCPNIKSSDLSALQTFKNMNYLFQNKKQGNKALISIDKERKQSLSSKKRNSRIKINTKNSQKHRESQNEQNLTQGSQVMLSSPSYPLFENKRMNTGNYLHSQSQKSDKFTNLKSLVQESTLIETKKFDETFQNLNSQFSKISLNESKQQNINNSTQKHNVKHYCLNHAQKLAKYKLNKDIQRPYYCQKCAVLLITKGYSIIQKIEIKNQRFQKLKNFISELQMLEPHLKYSFQNIYKMKSKIKALNIKSKHQIQEYYKTLILTLQTHKQTCIKSLDYHTNQIYRQLDIIKMKINQNQSQIIQIKNDIVPNFNQIISQQLLPETKWKKIINQHQDKMNSIKIIVQQTMKIISGKQKKIFMKMVDVPQSQIKSVQNLLERTQIVFKDKLINIESSPIDNIISHKIQHKSIQNLHDRMDETKRSFSFDDQNIDNSFYIPSSHKKNRQQNPLIVQNMYELTDSIRLSFGNRMDNISGSIQSPTFKAI